MDDQKGNFTQWKMLVPRTKLLCESIDFSVLKPVKLQGCRKDQRLRGLDMAGGRGCGEAAQGSPFIMAGGSAYWQRLRESIHGIKCHRTVHKDTPKTKPHGGMRERVKPKTGCAPVNYSVLCRTMPWFERWATVTGMSPPGERLSKGSTLLGAIFTQLLMSL